MTAHASPVSAPPAPQTVTGLAGRLFNLANRRRIEWCPIAVPYKDARNLKQECTFLTDRGLKLRAVKCEDVGTHSTIFRVHAPFDPMQAISGTLTQIGDEKKQTFAYHPWSFDDPKALVPKIAIRVNNQDHWCRDFDVLEIEDGHLAEGGTVAHPCYQRWHFVGRCGNSGFIVEGWVTFYHQSPIADVRVAIVWSDRNDPNMSKWIQGILFETGEITKFDFGLRNGMLESPVHNGSGWVNAVLGSGGPDGQSLGFIDGSGIPLSGRMLCGPQVGAAVNSGFDTDDANADANQRRVWDDVETLFAAGEAPVYGVAERSVWHGKWLAHGNVANIRRDRESLAAEFGSLFDGFRGALGSWAGFYADRFIGISKDPGRTGDQEDFGATKGWAAVNLGDARWIHYAMYSVVADYFRGFMHYEGGKRLDPMAHPNWVTWSGYTHWHHGQSSDRLGKADAVRDTTTYWGYDDQHRSQNNLAATYALTGDPLLRFVIEHISATDIANVRYRNDFGVGASRAVGRTSLCWSHFYRLTEVGSVAHTRYRTLLEDMATRAKRFWLGDFPGPVDVFAAFTDPRMGITWNNEPIRAWVVWEQGLFLQGTYAAWKVTGIEDYLDLTKRVAKSVVKYGCFKSADDNLWWMCNHVHWSSPNQAPLNLPEGEPVPPQWYSKQSTLVNYDRGGVATWTFPAFPIYLETADPNDDALSRAREVIQDWHNGQNSSSTRTAEWLACCGDILPQPGDHLSYDFDALRPELAVK